MNEVILLHTLSVSATLFVADGQHVYDAAP